MKQLSLLLGIWLSTSVSLVYAQITDETTTTEITQKDISSPKGQWFLGLGGGLAVQIANPTHSVNSEHLNETSVGSTSPFIGAKFGYRYNNKHHGAITLEKTQASNSFIYIGDYGEGLGVNRGIDYVFVNVEYSYNLLNAKRFWLGPSLQLGGGAGDNSSSHFYDRGREQYFTTPQGISYHKYEIVRAEIPKFIFNYGVGVHFGVEVIDNKFYIGTAMRFLHSFAPVHEYEINYQNNLETLNFVVTSPLTNLHFGLQLAYMF